MQTRLYILTFLLAMSAMSVSAQSSMSDGDILTFVMKEQKAGTSQSEIVTKLVQRGVNVQQIQRVRKKYERLQKDQGLGAVKDETLANGDNRLRKNNGDKKKEVNSKDARLQEWDFYTNQENQDEDTKVKKRTIQDNLDDILPDSLDLYDRHVIQQYLKNQNKYGKKVFGRDIFNQQDLTFEPNMNIATPQNYRLGPGDAVNIDIYGASVKNLTATVSPDGYIVIEDFGPVQVSGLTVAQANARIRSQLGARYQSSKIRLSVGQTRTIVVNVMGEVKAPGTYTLSAFASVFHALYMAGGTSDIGTLRNIKVYRNNHLVSTVDIYDYILNGKLSGNVRLGDNDVIVVGPYDCLVKVNGKVKRPPMYYEMKKNESLQTLIKYAGGFTGDAYKKSVRVVRKSGKEYAVYNVGEFDMSSFHVEDGDSVNVDSILPRYSNMVELKGAVFRPGMYQLGGDINSVKSLLEHADGVTEDAFTAHAVMHRMKEDRTLEVISVDVDGIMSGKVADIPLQKEDVLFIPTKQSAMTEPTITIHGEVQYPGVYKYASNETLEDFVLQAGGLKETAATVNVFVSRRTNDPKAITTDSISALTYNFALKDGFVIDGESGFKLQPFDEVYVRKSPAYNIQQNISISGQVIFPGIYTLSKKNERLSDVIKKAGGFNDLAYIPGARLIRHMNQEERVRAEQELKMRKKQNEQLLMEQALKSGRSATELQSLTATNQQELEQIPETYQVGIEMNKAMENPGSASDIILREGDQIIVPVYNATVKISGEVMYPNSIGYHEGKSARYYINQAGGFSSRAKKSQCYVIYMNGEVAKGSSAKIMPGCEIVVPTKIQNKMTTAETMSIGTGIASMATMIATIANLIK